VIEAFRYHEIEELNPNFCATNKQNNKCQKTNNKQITILKIPNRWFRFCLKFEYWILELVWNLVLGFCDFRPLAAGIPHMPLF
jgi:hypothetical protein